MANDISKHLALISAGYREQLNEYGISPKGVLWENKEGQEMRFERLIKVMGADIHRKGLSVNDLGCGYGAFFEFLKDMPPMEGGRYYGYDICEDMIAAARGRTDDQRCTFLERSVTTQTADYSFASGTYNMKGTAPDRKWKKYVKESLLMLSGHSTKGIAFNLLDERKKEREDWLYYADPEEFVDYCRTNISPNVELVERHPLDDCTILIRKLT